MRYLVAGLAALLSSPTTAEVIDFTPLAFAGGTTTPDHKFDTVVVGDYRFTALQPASTPLIVRAAGNKDNADPGGATLGIATAGDALGFDFARVDGAAFDFTGAQLTHLFNSTTSGGNGGTFAISADGVQRYSATYDIAPGFQTYAFSILGAHSINITSINYFQIDNLLVSSAVPEPAGWLMMIAGLGLIGGSLRLRRTGARRQVA